MIVEEWLAREVTGKPPTGTKNPIFFECEQSVDGHTSRQEMLVKPSPSGVPQAREYIGNVMARAFGLRTPTPVVVTLDQEDMGRFRRDFNRRRWFLGSTITHLAGSHKVALGANLPLTTDLPVELMSAATRLFAFDMLSYYADRTEENPNCSCDAQGLLVFDFEQCFPEEPRMVSEGLLWEPCARGLARYHCLYRHIKGKNVPLEFLPEAVTSLSGDKWRRLCDALPDEWQAEVERILVHAETISAHLADFRNDLENALR